MLRPQQSYRFPTRFHNSGQGFTLVELMVALFLLSLISTVLIALVSQSSALVSHGTEVIALNQRARVAIDKIGPYVLTAVDDSGSPALNSPMEKTDTPDAEHLDSYKAIQFTTTEDFLNPSYDPRADYDVSSPIHYYYEIAFDETAPTSYTLANGTNVNLGKIVLRRYTDASFSTIDTAVEPRPLAYNIQYFRCHVLTSNSLEVIVHTVGKRKGPGGNLIDVFEDAQGILNIPSPTYL